MLNNKNWRNFFQIYLLQNQNKLRILFFGQKLDQIQLDFCILGAIQQLRGQEEGKGGQQKVHTCPPKGGGPLNVHVDNIWKKSRSAP